MMEYIHKYEASESFSVMRFTPRVVLEISVNLSVIARAAQYGSRSARTSTYSNVFSECFK